MGADYHLATRSVSHFVVGKPILNSQVVAWFFKGCVHVMATTRELATAEGRTSRANVMKVNGGGGKWRLEESQSNVKQAGGTKESSTLAVALIKVAG